MDNVEFIKSGLVFEIWGFCMNLLEFLESNEN